jgi:hypothetical protein
VAAGPAFAGPDVLTNGADLWHTQSGFTFSSFEEEPIPAGFFCEGSKPFTGIVQLKGSPLATLPAGALGNIDTIVRRLDDAVLDAKGEGKTRIQLLALSLASVKPVDTGCGLYDVAASLTGEQPITEMKLVRTSQLGGHFIAPLELKVKLVFKPVSGTGQPRELVQTISLGPGSSSVWSYGAEKRAERVQVDTDGDLTPDTVMPGPSNFTIGVATSTSGDCYKIRKSCHCAKKSTDPYEPNRHCKHLHCTEVRLPCDWPDPPEPPAGVPYIESGDVETFPAET